MKSKYVFYEDDAHGWLEVERKELAKLEIEDQISEYSYQNGDKVYLEEDVDASLFLKKFEEHFKKPIKLETHELEHDDNFILKYQHYQPTATLKQ